MITYISEKLGNYIYNTDLMVTIMRSHASSGQLDFVTDAGLIRLLINEADIESLKDEFDLAISELVEQIKNGLKFDDLSSALLDDKTGLAKRGQAMLNLIFGPIGSAYLRSKINQINKKKPVLIINTDIFHVPWECMFTDSIKSPDKDTSLEDLVGQFWGVKFIIARYDLLNASSIDPDEDRKDYIERPSVFGVAIDDSLVYARSEQNIFKEMDDEPNNKISVVNFACDSDCISDFNKFLHDKKLALIHIACHTEVQHNSLLRSSLQLSEDKRFKILDLHQTPGYIKADLIFLNACSTSIDPPLKTINFVHSFQKHKNVANIIATENLIESQVAEQFAESFYEHFLQGEPLGESLYIARKSALESAEAKNIVSLFYSLHGNPFFHLKD